MEVIPLDLECIQEISAVKLNLPTNLVLKENKNSIRKTLSEVKRKFGDDVPVIDPLKEMKI